MKIEDLDEAQGLTAEMVRQHIAGLGYAMRECPEFPVCKSLGRHSHHGGVGGVDFAIADSWEGNERAARMLDLGLGLLASLANCTVQSLLRDINPRMRPWPSIDAVEAHERNGGRWVSKAPGDDLIRCLKLSADREAEDPIVATDEHLCAWWARARLCRRWMFWPCDAHGNKIRWPERDGVML